MKSMVARGSMLEELPGIYTDPGQYRVLGCKSAAVIPKCVGLPPGGGGTPSLGRSKGLATLGVSGLR